MNAERGRGRGRRRRGSRGGVGADAATSGAHVACGDCERIRSGWVAQPANTLSSLALVAAAAPVWRRARAAGEGRWQAVAGASALAGLGSVAYHGPGGRLGKAVHDIGVAALAAAAAGALAGDGRGPGAAGPHGRRGGALIAAIAVAVHASSRTGGPLCRPDSWWQGHAVWHLLLAAAIVRAAPARPLG